MKIFVLHQNDKELKRFQDYLNKYSYIYENIYNNIIYFKSFFYINEKYNFDNFDINFISNYKNIYTKKLNQNQLNHLLSIKKILEISIEKKYDNIMILEYDIYFHKNFNKLFENYDKLIKNNDIIHLGSSQHKWFDIITQEKISIKKWRDLQYYNNSHSLGTFAIILKKNIFIEYLNLINYVLSSYQYFPSDVILSILSRKYKSIVLYPNIIICNLDNSTIIKRDRKNDYIKFKWYKDKYLI